VFDGFYINVSLAAVNLLPYVFPYMFVSFRNVHSNLLEILSLMAKAKAKKFSCRVLCKKISVWLSFGWARMIAEEGRRQPSDLQKLQGR
jgi:hypothetical protein